MKTLAQALIHRRYIEVGATTRFVVLPLANSGLPTSLVETGQPVTLDLLAGRPVNLELSETGLSADLCFAGPPVRCTFPWDAVLAVQDATGELVQTIVVTVATIMEDESLRLAQTNRPAAGAVAIPNGPRPSISLVPGGGDPEEPQTPKRRPHLQLVESDE